MKSKLALVTGSFDPITVGHKDIISRAAKMFDSVIVLVANNEEKKYMFSTEERVEIARAAVSDIENVTVEGYGGYVADFAKERGACAFVRGIRDEKDVAYEQFMANKNYELCNVDTIMLFANPEYNSVSSTRVREALVSGEGANIMMTGAAYDKVVEIMKKNRKNA